MYLIFAVLKVLTLLPLLLTCASFPYYDAAKTAVTSTFAYFSRDKPVWVKVVWWGSYSHDIVNTVKQAMEVCEKCIADHKEPDWNCRDGIFDLTHTLISNVVTLGVGWASHWDTNGSVEDSNPNPVKRSLSTSPNSSFDDYSNIEINKWLLDFYSEESSGYWYPSSRNLVKRDLDTTPHIYLYHNISNMEVLLKFNPSSTRNGAISVQPVTVNSNTTHIHKRDYPGSAPLCHGYIAADFCTNHQQWAGFYGTGELNSMIGDIINNNFDGSWTSDYYKLYTVEQDGKSEDWQMSLRMYWVDSNDAYIHWTKCDTGY